MGLAGWRERGCHVWRHYVRRVGAPENSLTPPLKVGRFSALTDWWGEEGGEERVAFHSCSIHNIAPFSSVFAHERRTGNGRAGAGRLMYQLGWHSLPGQMRPAGRPPDLECGRGWRDSLTFVRSAFAFYSQTPSQKRKGVQYCMQ